MLAHPLLPFLLAAATAAAAPPGVDEPVGSVGSAEPVEFDARAAEHLLNRAGFGATPTEVAAAVDRGLDATVERLFDGSLRPRDPFFAERHSSRNVPVAERRAELAALAGRPLAELGEDERRALGREWRRDRRRADQAQLVAYTEWWLDGVIDGEDPLRDRLTLFWMGYFTSSQEDVRDSLEMIEQHAFLREHALGSFETLLRGIARDPAMLEYLDNDDNRAASPNENFARELLELFTLGEGGGYTERDVVEAARAFTGWTDRRGESRFRSRDHDKGEKQFLGRTGRFDGDDILTILLEEPGTARYVARRLLAHLEGVEPSPERVERYADLLLEREWEVAPVVRALFSDPDFYRAGVVGNRIAGPLDLLVGHARRIGVEPPARMVAAGARMLGQHVFYPPNVKGWEGDEAWITTSTFMQRGNLAGVLLGVVAVGELLDDPLGADPALDGDGTGGPGDGTGGPGDMRSEVRGGDSFRDGGTLRAMLRERRDARMAAVAPSRALRELGRTERLGWEPRYHLAARLDRRGAVTDGAAVDALFDELLAVPVGPGTRAEVLQLLATQRAELDLDEGGWVAAGPDAEHLLRRTAHLILSLPEAQLH